MTGSYVGSYVNISNINQTNTTYPYYPFWDITDKHLSINRKEIDELIANP